jgi:hypothetical protein
MHGKMDSEKLKTEYENLCSFDQKINENEIDLSVQEFFNNFGIKVTTKRAYSFTDIMGRANNNNGWIPCAQNAFEEYTHSEWFTNYHYASVHKDTYSYLSELEEIWGNSNAGLAHNSLYRVSSNCRRDLHSILANQKKPLIPEKLSNLSKGIYWFGDNTSGIFDCAWVSANVLDYYNSFLVCNHTRDHTYKKVTKLAPILNAFENGLFMIFPYVENNEPIVEWLSFPKLKTELVKGMLQLHSDGSPAFEISYDKFYFWHGTLMPEKYGSVVSEKWEPKWILEEKNSELRRILIQNIGYSRICHELNTKKIDSWREYELLEIIGADVEPVVMIKMVCPSTGIIHAHRVPSYMNNARQAITWINNGTDPEEFLIER